MTHRTDRRRLLGGVAAAAGAAALSPLPAACPLPAAAPRATGGDEPLYGISLAQWSLHKALWAKDIDNLDFAATSADLGIHAIEYVNSFFKAEALNNAYLDEMATRAADVGVTSLLIMVDGEGALGDADEAQRARAIQKHVRWLYAAKHLGCHSIRVNAQSSGSWEEQRERAADGLHRLCAIAEGLELNVIVENHGGLSSNGKWLAETIAAADHPRAGTLPDFGNFRVQGDEWYDRYQGVEELMPYAKAVSAKSHEFDDAGNEVNTDFRRMMQIVLDAGYRGYVGVEYEGSKHDERAGIRLTRELLERVREELAG